MISITVAGATPSFSTTSNAKSLAIEKNKNKKSSKLHSSVSSTWNENKNHLKPRIQHKNTKQANWGFRRFDRGNLPPYFVIRLPPFFSLLPAFEFPRQNLKKPYDRNDGRRLNFLGRCTWFYSDHPREVSSSGFRRSHFTLQ